jgi:Flp pilus assembly protein protease CpaA
MTDAPPEEGLPPSLRFLKGLVIVLTLTMIGGVITVVGLLVTRMPQAFGGLPALPEALEMPEGTKAQAVTFAEGLIAVVTTDGRILVFSAEGRLRQEIALEPGAAP